MRTHGHVFPSEIRILITIRGEAYERVNYAMLKNQLRYVKKRGIRRRFEGEYRNRDKHSSEGIR